MTLSRRFNSLIPFLKVVIAVTIIYLMVEKGLLNPEQLVKSVHGTDLLWCFFLVFIGVYLSAVRWLLLLLGQGFQLTLRQVFSLQLVGLFFNFVVPGGVGGDLIKGYYLVKAHDEQKFLAATSIFMDRLIGLYTIILMVIASGPFIGSDLTNNPKIFNLYKIVILIGLVATGMLALAFSKRIHEGGWIRRFCEVLPYGDTFLKSYESIHKYGLKLNIIFKATMLSVLLQYTSVLFFYIIGRSMGLSLSLGAYMFIVPLGFVCSSLPITPGGIGIGQMAFMGLFNLYLGVESQMGPNSISIYQIICFIWGLFGGAIYLFNKRYATST